MKKPWQDRFSEFLERVMAAAAAGSDPKPFQDELKALMAEKPKDDEQNAKS